jgi:hypothetical protein
MFLLPGLGLSWHSFELIQLSKYVQVTFLPALVRLDAPVASMVDLSVVANLRATLAARRGIIVL